MNIFYIGAAALVALGLMDDADKRNKAGTKAAKAKSVPETLTDDSEAITVEPEQSTDTSTTENE